MGKVAIPPVILFTVLIVLIKLQGHVSASSGKGKNEQPWGDLSCLPSGDEKSAAAGQKDGHAILAKCSNGTTRGYSCPYVCYLGAHGILTEHKDTKKGTLNSAAVSAYIRLVKGYGPDFFHPRADRDMEDISAAFDNCGKDYAPVLERLSLREKGCPDWGLFLSCLELAFGCTKEADDAKYYSR